MFSKLNISIVVIFLVCFVFSNLTTKGQETFCNPIISGAYPDPSICKVGDDFYLSNSSFEYFPGVSLWHSKDLVHWEHAGFGIHRKDQFDFEGIATSAGAWAGTIRYNDGTFYLPLTWVDWRMKVGFKNVILTAKDPKGPWSNPYVITDTIWGIDPALFFDDDGKTYWLMNHPSVGFKHEGAASIMIQELDLKTMKLVGSPSFIGRGAMLDSKYPEGPKMFKKDGYYYLMIAEGGTGQFHAVTISRSKNITGPYENYEANPILTHRNMGYTASFTNIGHADMVQTSANEWWMVCLGSRPLAGKDNILGRETFLVPVQWNSGEWPIVNPGIGQVIEKQVAPKLPSFNPKQGELIENFNDSLLSHEWSFIRTPSDFYSINTKLGYLALKLLPLNLSQTTSPAFIGKRLKYRSAIIKTKLIFDSRKQNEEAGLVLYKSEKANIKFTLSSDQKQSMINVATMNDTIQTVLCKKMIPSATTIFLKIEQDENNFSFYYSLDGSNWQVAYNAYKASLLSVEAAGGFMGTFVGVYASSNGKKSDNIAKFDWFEYKK
jgi:alpha-N-arabinofuranosidase